MSPDERYEYLKDRLGNTIHICSTLTGGIADTVILYGISGHIIPTGNKTGLLLLGEDNTIPLSAGDGRVVYIEIDEHNLLSKAIEDGKLDIMNGRPTYIFGMIKDIRHSGDKTEFLIHPTKGIRIEK